MSKTIRTYKELVAYQTELEQLLAVQKQVIRQDVENLKNELRPVTNAIGIASKFFIRNKVRSVFVKTVSSLIELVLKKKILSRASWPGRLLVPFFTRNILSHLMVAEHREQLFEKLREIISHGKKKH